MDDKTRTELEAATFRRLVEHLRERTDVQNIDLMNLAGFCRNCLSKWYRAEAEDRGLALSDPESREIVGETETASSEEGNGRVRPLFKVPMLGVFEVQLAEVLVSVLPVRKAGSIEEAVRLGLEMAPEDGTVILAPACASQDMFRDYEERGERFAAAARELARD